VKHKRTLWAHGLALLGSISLSAAHGEEDVHFSVEEGPAKTTLNQFAHQARLLYLIDPDQFHGVVTHAIHGTMSIEAALRMLLAGTAITYKLSADHTYVDFKLRHGQEARAAWTVRRRPLDVAQGEVSVGGRQSTEEEQWLSNVVVTGTRIHGSGSVGARVIAIDHAELQNTGFTSIGDFLRGLPQVFGGGPTQDTHLGTEAQSNTGLGTGINLRGLGAGATLILLNGYRLAPSGSAASFTDVSNIPLGAVDHIEILTDSASATYGSDAVAGVVNIITRRGTQPAVTFAQWSSVGSGSEHAGTIYQTVTRTWSSGDLIVALGGSHQTPLAAEDRRFYTADLRYDAGPNLNLPESYPPVLTSLNGSGNWSLPSGGTPNPTVGDFKQGLSGLADRYQDADIIPSQDHLNGYARLSQSVNEVLTASVDALVSRRRSTQLIGPEPVDIPILAGSPYYVNLEGNGSPLLLRTNLLGLLGPEAISAVVTVYNVSMNTQMTIGDRGSLTVALHRASEREAQVAPNTVNTATLTRAVQTPDVALDFNPYDQALDRSPTLLAAIRGRRRYDSLSQIGNVSVTLDGVVSQLPAGPLRGAVGAELNNQSFRLIWNDLSSVSETRSTRRVIAGYAELTAPLLSSDIPGLERVEVSVSARREAYSDFGAANTPRAGLEWTLVDGLVLYGSYGHSFRAPDLGGLDESRNTAFSRLLPDATSPSHQSRALVLSGNDSTLKQERATERSLGLKAHLFVSPQTALDVDLHYFSIRFEDRIEAPAFSDQLLNNDRYAYLVTRDPTPAQVQAACSSATYLNFVESCSGSNPAAIIDLRLRNSSQLATSGIDFETRWKRDTPWGSLSWRTNGTYLLQYAAIAYPGAPEISRLSTDHYPINLRVIDSLDWHRGRFDASVSMNYVNHYRDVDSQPNRAIGSFITFDWHLKWSLCAAGRPLEVTAGMQNALDRAVPFVANTAAQVAYDQENFDPQGRVLFLNVSRHW
jgi:iron complex outermembrane receptor protein